MGVHWWQMLYDEDVVAEVVILKWDEAKKAARALGVSSSGAKAVRKAAFPLVDWLRNAESDSDEE
jgi:hypothetical protein